MKIFAFLFSLLLSLFSGIFTPIFSQTVNKGIIKILYSPGKPLNSFVPSKNIGGAVDGHFKGDINKMLTPENISEMKKSGLKPVSYRLRTELAGEVWHWNPEGKWSDSAKQQGYWVSDTTNAKPIEISYGYRLPRRGNTHDQANDDGYSRIDDGDTTTFWKSDPYLDSLFTGESNELHPQWVIIDLGKRYRVNAIQIAWANPFALSYKVEYAKDYDPSYFDPYEPGIWHPFPQSNFINREAANEVTRLTSSAFPVRFVRISFTKSSYTSTKKSNDIRDKLGFAIKEIKLGFVDEKNVFHDWIRHSPDHKQCVIDVSSTDPWHTAKDIDPNVEQVGIDRFFTDGLTSHQAPLMPAALLYDTPENVLALVKYFKEKNYHVNELEMGEEPDGQLVSPTDYAALYFQLAKKILTIDSTMKFGGPSFATLSSEEEDSTTFTEANWTSLFLNYLKSHNGLDLFNFFSFEWYPFDDLCASSSPQLKAQPEMLSTAMKNIQKVLPANVPMYVTEYGYSAYEGKPEVEMQGALMYADILGKFIEMGGDKSFLYGYEPAFLQQSFNCGYGNNMLLGLTDDGKTNYKTASFYTTQMITQHWAQPSDSRLESYPSVCSITNKKDEAIVSAYSLRMPDGNWSVMLINKDAHRTFNVEVQIENLGDKKIISWKPSHFIQYSGQQYQWHADGLDGHPTKSLPPVLKTIDGTSNLTLPPYSLTVIN